MTEFETMSKNVLSGATVVMIRSSMQNRIEIRDGSKIISFLDFPLTSSGRSYTKRVFNAFR